MSRTIHFLQRGLNYFISSVLVLTLLTPATPSFFVNAAPSNKIQVKSASEIVKTIQSSTAKENTTKRTRNAKYYESINGSGYAIVTGHSQHFLNTSNNWQDIDSTIIKGNYEQNFKYQNKANRFKVQFKDKSDGYFTRIKNNGESLELGLVGASLSGTVTNQNNITYKEILKNIDLSFTIGEDSLKEDIVINEKPNIKNLTYRIKISRGLLIINQDTAGLKIVDKAGKLLWHLNSPMVMGRVTGDPILGKYDLTKVNDQEYTASFNLSSFLPPEELGIYPVVIDPTVIIPDQNGAVIDNANFFESGLVSNLSRDNSVIQVGGTTLSGEGKALLRFSVPNLPNIDTAILSLASNEEKSSVTRIKAYRPASDWSRDTLDWYNQPAVASVESSATGSIAWNWWNFNLTNLVKDWVNGAPNYGVGLMAQSSTDSRRNFLCSYAVDHFNTPSEHPSAFRPYLTVYYNNNYTDQILSNKLLGSQSWQRYVTTSLAEGGANVNIANGNLTVNFQDLSVDGVGFDTVISHTYNSKKNADSSFGYNWTLSANKHLEISTDRKKAVFVDETDSRFEFNDIDGNGVFVEGILETASGYYKTENKRPNGLNWGLRYDGTNNQFVAINTSGIRYVFNTQGNILKETDRNNNSLDYEYADGLLTAISNNGSSLKVRLFYDTNRRLKEIIDLNSQNDDYRMAGQNIVFTYDSGDLKTVSRYNDAALVGTTTYGYSAHQLIAVTDAKNQTTRFNAENGKVTSIVDALDKVTTILYNGPLNGQVSTTSVISPKGNEAGADKNAFTSKYYYYHTPNFHYGTVVKEDTPPTKTDTNPNPTVATTEYDYNDDYQITAVVDPAGAVEASAYDDISGLLVYQFSKEKYLALKNSYNVGNYELGNWRLLDSYNANGVQTVYSYDSKGNVTRKSIVDGDNINLLHNPGFESASRIDANRDGLADFDILCDFAPKPEFGFRWEDVGDYWCFGGQGSNRVFGLSSDAADGLNSQIVGYNNNTNTSSANVYQAVDEAIRTEPGVTYKLNYKYKQDTDRLKVQIALIHYDNRDNAYPTVLDDTPSPYSTGWNSDSFTFTTPNYNSPSGYPYYTTEIFMRIVPNGTGIVGKTLFDTVKLQKGTAQDNPVEKYSSFTYNDRGQVIKERTPEGKDIFYTWNGLGNLASVTDALGNKSTFEYDLNGNKTSKTEPEGNKTVYPKDFMTLYTYNGQGLITSVTEAKTGLMTMYTYDKNNDLETSITPNGLKTTYINDRAGRPVETINPYGYKSKVDYDANGNPTGITDPNKKSSGATYDGADRLEKETDTDNKETAYSYDKNDNIKVISKETKTIAYEYDKNERLTSESLNGTVASSYGYDRESNLTTNTAGGVTASQSYSLTDEITKVSIAGQEFSYHRNKNNQLTSIDKSNGDVVSYGYNDAAQVTSLTHARGTSNIAKYSYEYDGNGNRTKVTTQSGSGTPVTQNYTYDNNNQLVSTDSTQYTYDNAGNIKTRVIWGDETRSYTYAGNRMTKSEIHYRDGIPPTPQVYGYDANGNLTSTSAIGGSSSLLHLNGSSVNVRDNSNAEIKGTTTYVAGKFGQALNLDGSSYVQYNSSSNLNLPEGTVEFWVAPNWSNDSETRTFFEYYVDQNNYIKLTKNLDNKLELKYVKDGYNYGSITPGAMNWVAGQWTHLAFSWNTTKTVLYMNGTQIASHTFLYNGLKTLTSPAEKITFGATASTLTPSLYANAAFDEVTIWPTVKTLTELQTSYRATSENSYKPLVTYGYDSDDYLTTVTKSNGTVIGYTYDAQKRLTKRTETGKAEIIYAYDGNVLISETQSGAITKYIYDADGGLLYIDQSGNRYYPIYDGLGSITMLRDQSGNTVATYTYDEWGKIVSKTGSVNQPLRFASYYWDESAGLYHLGARWYDPVMMRFISVDPHPGDQDDSLSLNEYVYCRSNPVNYTDPDGDYVETALDVASVAYSANEFKKNKSWGNAGWLAFDAVMLALPIGTGSGVVRAGIKASKGGKSATNLRWQRGYLTTHYAKHGAEFSVKNAKEYSNLSKKVIKNSKPFAYVQNGKNHVGYYNKTSKIFVGVGPGKNGKNVIKTMFKTKAKYIKNLKKRR